MNPVAFSLAATLAASAIVVWRPQWRAGVLVALAATALQLGLVARGTPLPDLSALGPLALSPLWRLLLGAALTTLVLNQIAATGGRTSPPGALSDAERRDDTERGDGAGAENDERAAIGIGLASGALALVLAASTPRLVAMALFLAALGTVGAFVLLPSHSVTSPTRKPTTGATHLADVHRAVRYLVAVAVQGTALTGAALLINLYQRTGDDSLLGPATGLFVVGLAIALGVFPFQFWLPSLLDTASGWGTALTLAWTQTMSIGLGLSWVVLLPWLIAESRRETLVLLAASAVVVCGLLAIGESTPPRALGYLLGLQGATWLVGLALRNQTAATGVGLGAVSLGLALVLLIRGLMWGRRCWPFLVIATFNLVGLPPTPGFWSRALILSTAFPEFPLATAMLLTGQLLAIIAAGRHSWLLARGWFTAPSPLPLSHQGRGGDEAVSHQGRGGDEARWGAEMPVFALAATALVVIGCFPAPVADLLMQALADAPLAR
ncbi:MAG: hypothetical protein HYY04_08435 [Chloroflexi bacterium]|nr:hypothetical protein [Chloroflexota bacterium]